jgi:TRAP-type mannitol/chloroaromatic compound transport system permease small subunit
MSIQPERLIGGINRFSEQIGKLTSWLILLMVLIIGYDVLMRSLFHIGSVALQELEWHLFALVFLLGSGYTLKHDGHVRVDIFYQSRWMNEKKRAWVDVFGVVFLLIPFCLLVIVSSLPFVFNAFVIGEGSPDAGGLPYRFLLKLAIPIGFLLVLLQGLANLMQNILLIKGDDHRPGSSTEVP